MHIYDIIASKRDGNVLSKEEIEHIISGYSMENVPDYQMAAFLMAVFIRGMGARETSDLTNAMLHSGEVVDLSGISGFKVDKHSTGGVGDTTTLVLAPLVAACGVPVAKMSGRGLGHTGGTLDKLESFPGFQIGVEKEKFINNVNTVGIAVIGQTANVAPADKKIYALRDVTATVNSIPLIAASIMSKKLAAGSDGIVLDVKTGTGAFMQELSDARELAQCMIEIGKLNGKKMNAIISDMGQPLGHAIGNKLEVREAILTLSGAKKGELLDVCLVLGSLMLVQAGMCTDRDEAAKLLAQKIENGEATEKLRQMVKAQNGDPSCIDDPDSLLGATVVREVKAEAEGFVTSCDALKLGKASFVLGAGRETKEDEIDLDAGVIIHKKIGDEVKRGDLLAVLYANGEERISESEGLVREAYEFGNELPEAKLVHDIL